MRYEFDPRKAKTNKEKHGVTFEQGIEAVEDPNRIVNYDLFHSSPTEERFQVIGKSKAKGILFVVICEIIEGELTRVISARCATEVERAIYRRPKTGW